MNATPVTVLITRRVRRGGSQRFERLMGAMQAAAAEYPGHMGGFLIPPEEGEQGCWRVLFAFDTQAHLQTWTESPERLHWLHQIAEVTYGDTAMRVLSGLETWFALPASHTKAPPPRWKMALITWLGIFPLVLLTSHTIGPLLSGWVHPLLLVLLSTGLITAAMTWVVMPTLVPIFSHWLYPAAAESASAPPVSEEA